MPDARRRRALEQFAERARDAPATRRLDLAAVEALEAFDAAGVDALLLKGPVLARSLYEADEHRGYSDVDLLVAPDALPDASHTLAGLGYVNVHERLGIDDLGGALDAETWVGQRGGPADGLMIDLHWQVAGAFAPAAEAWTALASRRAWIDLEGRRVPTVDTEAQAMHVAIHAAQHGPGYPKPLEDLSRGLERWPVEVWRGAEQLAAEIQATSVFAAGLRMTPGGLELADSLGLPPTEEIAWAIANRRARPRGTFHLEAFANASTMAERAFVLRRSLLPRPEWMAWQYRWARAHGVRLIAAYCVHLIRAPVWALSAWRFSRRARRSG